MRVQAAALVVVSAVVLTGVPSQAAVLPAPAGIGGLLTRSAGTWVPLLDDKFDRGSLGPDWSAYSGTPGGNRAASWHTKQVRVAKGKMRIRASKRGSKIVSGGVSNHKFAQTYGKWSVRVRVQKSADLKYVLLLWPTEGWPPEIDFAEDGGGNRKSFQAFLHYDEDNKQVHRTLRKTNLTKWHEVGVQWRPGLVEYTIDGRVWASVSGSMVPSQPMWLAIQTEALRGARKSTPRHTDLLVDRVRIWSWQP